jgi:hypothetical protein
VDQLLLGTLGPPLRVAAKAARLQIVTCSSDCVARHLQQQRERESTQGGVSLWLLPVAGKRGGFKEVENSWPPALPLPLPLRCSSSALLCPPLACSAGALA